MAEKKFRDLVLSSSFDEISKLKPYLDNLQSWATFSDKQYKRIRLAVNEAVTNAMVHGNKEDSQKTIQVESSLAENVLRISVEDEGEGYPDRDIPDPTQEENLLNQSGRGLYLIKQYTQKVVFKKDRRQLVMHFNLNDEQNPA